MLGKGERAREKMQCVWQNVRQSLLQEQEAKEKGEKRGNRNASTEQAQHRNSNSTE